MISLRYATPRLAESSSLAPGQRVLWSNCDRGVRVEVGYGLEGALPDGKVGAILDARVIPRSKSGEFDKRLLAGVD